MRGKPEPETAVEDTAEREPSSPPAGGSPADGQQAPDAGGDKTTPQPDAELEAVGKDLLDKWGQLLDPEGKKTPDDVQVPDELKSDELEKRLNDNSISAEIRIKEAQSFIGTQRQRYGEAVKGLREQLGQKDQQVQVLVAGQNGFRSRFSTDDKGNITGAKGSAVIELWNLVPPAEQESVLAQMGAKLVPLDAKIEGGQEPAEMAWERAYVNKVMPGNDQTHEEKLAAIEANPKLSRQMTTDLSAWKAARRSQQDAYQREQGARRNADDARDRQLADTFLAEARKNPLWEKGVKRAINTWNKIIPQNVGGEARIRLLNLAARLAEVPEMIASVRKASYDLGIKHGSNLSAMGAMPGGGEAPDKTTGDLRARQPGTGKQRTKEEVEAENALGARSGSISGGEAV